MNRWLTVLRYICKCYILRLFLLRRQKPYEGAIQTQGEDQSNDPQIHHESKNMGSIFFALGLSGMFQVFFNR